MKKFVLALTVPALLTVFALPVHAAPMVGSGLFDAFEMSHDFSKRKKPRVPGGSGCDDPQDLIEHPECKV